jgi:hypothetical protein
MPAIVIMDVYSSMPNPTWVIDDEKLRELQKLLSAGGAAVRRLLPVLGYRGFLVRPARSPERFAQEAGDIVVVGNPEAERFLLSTAGPHLSGELKELAAAWIARGIDPAVLQRAGAALAVQCPVCHAADAPAYNPAFWNNPAHLSLNNCYNYANNQQTDTFAQPGRATGHPITGLSCPGVQPSAVSDGLKACPDFTTNLPAGKGWYVALVIYPGHDYHWYRQDKIGCWSHKPGHTPVINTDNSGHAITDPKTCNRGNYTVFCTFMITTHGVHIH